MELQGIRGAMVAWPSRKVIIDAIQLKKILEGFVIKEFIKKVTKDDFIELEDILIESEKAFLEGDFKKSEFIGSRFHSIVTKKYGNIILQTIIDDLQEQIDRVRPLIWQISKEMLQDFTFKHREILDAIVQRDL